MTTETPALALEGISKRFGSVQALHDVSLHVATGEVHALLGENGAGKTTLMHIAFGMVKPDAGTVRVRGAAVPIDTPADAIAAGLGMVHQHFTLVPAMSVAENLALGGHGLLRRRCMVTRVSEIASVTGFALEPDALVETLPVGAQQRVEIAKALAQRARLLILDEPTAVLAPSEADELLRWLRRFADAGNAVVLITHKLHEALAVSNRVTVLRHGRVVHAGAAAGTSPQALTSAMIGHSTISTRDAGPEASPSARTAATAPAFTMHDVTVEDDHGVARLRGASLVVFGGEILGIAGVEGAGQRELLRALAGRATIRSGSLERPGRVGFVPEDRHQDAVLLNRSLTDNVALRDAGRRRGYMAWRTFRVRARALMNAFDVRAPSPESPIQSLSGGNQQKLVLAREISDPAIDDPASPASLREPAGLVVENPTRGLDVRAAAEIHARLRAARDGGAAVVLYSSDLDEVLALANRVVVLHGGMLRETTRDRAAVGHAMLGID